VNRKSGRIVPGTVLCSARLCVLTHLGGSVDLGSTRAVGTGQPPS
jgi:hypothetical protein